MTLTPPAAPIPCQRMGIRVPQNAKRRFAEALKDWRSRSNLSQSQAAVELGLSIRTLQNWEIARTKPSGALEALLYRAMDPPRVTRKRR